MNCDSVRSEIIAYLKDEVEAGKRKRLEEHLAKCSECRKELEKARHLLDWTEAASDEAVVSKVEEVFIKALTSGASDIHFESQRDDTLLVRIRIDGVLHEVARLDATQRAGIISRVKMLADLNVGDTSLPQDGRIKWSYKGRDFDLRTSVIPYIYGEGLVIRILDASGVLLGLDRQGFYPEQMDALEQIMRQPNGQLIVAGPTGSGKTTTLYSILAKLTRPEVKLMSVEDPVEYALPGVNQVHINKRAGLTFETALRSFLRQDPDIIMIGETKGEEIALLAVEAALTGHLVLSTIHADDAVGVITRLMDMGVQPYLIAATVVGVVAQRLAREVCKECGEPVEADLANPALKALGITAWDLNEHKIRRGKGCERCRNTGYKGRTAIHEVLTITPELRALIATGATGAELAETARDQGFLDLRQDAKRKVLDGITTPEEALRVVWPQW